MKIKFLLLLFLITMFLYVFPSIQISELGDKDLWNVEYINKLPNKNVSNFIYSNSGLYIINNMEIIHYGTYETDNGIDYYFYESVTFPDTIIDGYITEDNNIVGIAKNKLYIKSGYSSIHSFNMSVYDIIQEDSLYFILTEDSSVFVLNKSSYDTIWFNKYDNSTLNIVRDIRGYYIIAFNDRIMFNEFSETNGLYELNNSIITFTPVKMFFVLINSRYYLIIQDNQNNIHFLDITQIDNVSEIDSIQIDNNIKNICKTDDNYLYILDDNSNIYVYNFSNPAVVTLEKTFNGLENIEDIDIKRGYLHILNENGVVEVMDISYPKLMNLKFTENIKYEINCMYNELDTLYVSGYSGFYKFDISDINNIKLISQKDICFEKFIKKGDIFLGIDNDNVLRVVEYNDTIVKELFVDSQYTYINMKLFDNYILANTYRHTIEIFDINNINEIKKIASISDIPTIDMYLFSYLNDYLYIFSMDMSNWKYYEYIYDWTDKSSPQLLKKEKISHGVNSVFIENNNMFITTYYGLKIIDISKPLNTDDFVSYGENFAGTIIDMDKEHLILDTGDYVLIVDKSNIYNLKSVGFINYPSGYLEKTYENTFYINNMLFVSDSIQGVEIYKFSEYEDSDINNNIIIYPNPVYLSKQDFVTIKGVKNESMMHIYSSTGRLVKSIKNSDLLENEDYTLFIRDLPNGLYYVYIELISGDILKGQFAVIRK